MICSGVCLHPAIVTILPLPGILGHGLSLRVDQSQMSYAPADIPPVSIHDPGGGPLDSPYCADATCAAHHPMAIPPDVAMTTMPTFDPTVGTRRGSSDEQRLKKPLNDRRNSRSRFSGQLMLQTPQPKLTVSSVTPPANTTDNPFALHGEL